ncbi:MAG: hypothetical protein JXJ20_09920 [Anaerolineae bacterium]|nr:hypothetical protein [Anaerolineae bacterium]
MFERISNSWQLVKASAAVLRADKELIIFPIVSLIGTIMVFAVFAVPMLLAGAVDHVTDNGLDIISLAVAFLFYLVMYFVVIFCNTALVGAALIRLEGGDPTLSDGLRIAMGHVDKIFGYALISATVGMILRILHERGGLLGDIVAWLGEIAWNLATFLVVPVLVVEGIGPVEAIKRSTSLLKRTWGEQVIGNFSIGLIFGLLTFAAILLVGGPLIALAVLADSVAMIILVVLVIVFMVVAISLIGSALNGIYVAALYRYATEGEVSTYFSPELVQGAFKPKRG